MSAPVLAPLDQAVRNEITQRLDSSLIVEASAGTGKTTALVDRVLAVLKAGADVSRIAMLTFTHKAAGEMKYRLRQCLDRERAQAVDPVLVERLETAQEHLEEAYIGTIHGFCAQVLRERPLEARIDPLFTESDDTQNQRLFREAFDLWLEDRLQHGSPGVRRALLRLAWNRRDREVEPLEQLQAAAWGLAEWRHYDKPWRRDDFRREQCIDLLVKLAKELTHKRSLASNSMDELVKALQPVEDVIGWLERTEVQRERRYDVIEARLLQLLSLLRKDEAKRKGRGMFSQQVTREQVVQVRDDLVQHLTSFEQLADADLAALLKSEVDDLIDLHSDFKLKDGSLDFGDLLLRTRDLVRDHPDVRCFLQERYTHLFVDEFQDTDPVQAETLLLLSARDPDVSNWRQVRPIPGKLFVVGDPKQSIYKFRQADVGLYQQVRSMLQQQGCRLLHLTHSFRSNSNIQSLVNRAFEGEMQSRHMGQCDYEPLTGYTHPIPGQPSVVALPIGDPFGYRGSVTKRKLQAQLPTTIGRWIGWLIQESGWQVRDVHDRGRLVPVEPRHICVLFRKMNDYGSDATTEYVRVLEELEIPYAVTGNREFLGREEVLALVAALEAIEWPDDELAVYATLKGPFFGFADDVLFWYREQEGSLHPLRPRKEHTDNELAGVASALALLEQLHRRRNRRPASVTLNEFLNGTRAHASVALWNGGPQALANLARVVETARSYETREGFSFRDFVSRLADGELATDQEQGALEADFDGVQLMTVHKAKGLEFPIVILADIPTGISRDTPQRYVDPEQGLAVQQVLGCTPVELLEHADEERAREHAEGMRIAYVAATRARDLLVIPALGAGELKDSWVAPLHAAMMPTQPRRSEPAPGCPEFGEVTWLEDHQLDSVRPGLHRIEGNEVVWWDPQLLTPLRHRRRTSRANLLQESEREDDGSLLAVNWNRARLDGVARAAVPAFDLLRPSQTASRPAHPAPIEVVTLPDRVAHPGGRAFGRLIHAVLEHVDFAAHPSALPALIRQQILILGLSEDWEAPALDALTPALAWLQQQAAGAVVHREVPIDLNLESGKRLEGNIDLALLRDGAWHVIDYKTDADPQYLLREHEIQLQWYCHALTQLTGQPARGTILSL